MDNINLSDFLANEYVDFSSYDLVRKIANYIDGNKNASRKILHTVREMNINNFIKVSNLGPKVQDYTQYLHGSLEGSIVNITADYIGSGNNIPILQGDGNFGSAFITTPAASRYIFARQNETIKDIFRKEDTVLLEEQYFEGDKIEPKYYVPTIPMLLVNGSEGISIGFAQKILPRDPKQIIKWVSQRSNNKRLTADLTPHWVGQTFTVEPGLNDGQWVAKGSIDKVTKNKLYVTSIPVGYDLKQYQNVLDKLVDAKVIRNYDDLSDNDVFKFEISADKEFMAKDTDWILDKLKLIKTITENYTCIDENNKIVVFKSAKEILEAWYQKRLEFNQKRKDYILDQLEKANAELHLKMIFIQGVVSGDIELRNKSEAQIVLSSTKYNKVLKDHAARFMNLSIRTLTSEEIAKLKNKIAQNEAEILEWKDKTVEQISIKDVTDINV